VGRSPAEGGGRIVSATGAPPLVKAAVFVALALGAGAVLVALSLGAGRPVIAGGLTFEYLAHHTVMRDKPGTPGDRRPRFGGASGIAVLPGTLARDGGSASFRAAVVSDDRVRPTVHIVTFTFTHADEDGGAWSMDADVTGEIGLRHPLRDAESVVVLPSRDGNDWYAVSYERPPGVAALRDPPRRGDPRRDRRPDARLLPIPDEIARRVRSNRGFESLALRTVEGGATELWAALESDLDGDGEGATDDRGGRCRVLVYRVHDPENIALDRRLEYVTGPLPDTLLRIGRFNSLADATTLPDGSLAFMERHAAALGGYDATLFRVRESGDGGELAKTRLASVKEIAGGHLPWVGNYEGVCLGPSIAELTGDESETGHLMLFVADDNFGSDYQPGTQFLAVRVSGVKNGQIANGQIAK